jgi:putative heme iron utilization protein
VRDAYNLVPEYGPNWAAFCPFPDAAKHPILVARTIGRIARMSTADPVPATDPLIHARHVARGCDRAALAAVARPDTPEAGAPYASLVQVAFDHDASPILLISTLADHTKNLLADARCSLLFDGTGGLAEPLTGPRVSLQGTARQTADARIAERYLARFPGARMYAGFKDFAFWTVAPGRAHLVAGFGRIRWFDAFAFDASGAGDLAAGEADVIAHMNADHADAVALYATKLAGRAPGDWSMTGVDPEGFDLREAVRGECARLAFDKPVRDPETARVELIRLVKRARAAGPGAIP